MVMPRIKLTKEQSARLQEFFDQSWDAVMPNAVADANRYLIASKKDVPDTLLHFTDANGAVGILKNKYLRLARARSSNDPLELSYGIDIAREELAKITTKDDWVEMFRTEALNSLEGRMFLGHEPKEIPDPHICCFSSPGAEDDIPKWALYGQKGSGLILTFSGRELAAKPNVDLVKVVYERNRQVTMMRRVIKRGLQAASEMRGKAAALQGNKRSMEILTRIVGNAFGALISMHAAVMKRQRFKFEDEWRLMVSYLNVKTDEPQLHFDFFASGAIIKSYFECPIVPKDIKAVIVGSREADLNEPVVKMLLREYGYRNTTRITRGSSTLRG
jgi:hypothetical protein